MNWGASYSEDKNIKEEITQKRRELKSRISILLSNVNFFCSSLQFYHISSIKEDESQQC